MAFDLTVFRTNFPEFADQSVYPLTLIIFWAGIGDTMLNTDRWGDIRDQGLQLYVAHEITLSVRNQSVGAIPGGAPGLGAGVISNISVGGISVGIDTQASIESYSGHYNETNYGRQFIRLAKMVGMGGAQV
jgi:hypothetical protein